MKKIRLVFAALVFLMCAVAAGADSWYVCFGSFGVKENALRLQTDLEKADIDAFVVEQENGGKTVYRVLASQDDENAGYFIVAQNRRSMLNQVAKTLGITGLTLCEADPSQTVSASSNSVSSNTVPSNAASSNSVSSNAAPAKNERAPGAADAAENIPAVNRAQAVQLEKNRDAAKLSEDAPYTVAVGSYRDEGLARQESARLGKLLGEDGDAFVLGQYDDSSFLNFTVYAGAFENREDAEALDKKLKDAGIKTQGVADYNDIRERLESYDRVVEESEITFEAGETEIPEIFSEAVVRCINSFPVNRDYQIEEVQILDLDNAHDADWSVPSDSSFSGIEDAGGDEIGLLLHAASYASYRDSLFGKKVQVMIVEVEDLGALDEFIESMVSGDDTYKTLTIESERETFDCRYTASGEFLGVNRNRDLVLLMNAEEFSPAQLEEFVSGSYSGESLLIYPQLRTNLFILPENDRAERDFLYYSLSMVDDSYARSKDYAAWAVPIVGHWSAEAYFIQDDEEICTIFFNMDYNRNASSTYGIFQHERQEDEEDEYSHSEEVNGQDGWYNEDWYVKELSFSKDAYIIAVDCGGFADLGLDELKDFALDFKIW